MKLTNRPRPINPGVRPPNPPEIGVPQGLPEGGLIINSQLTNVDQVIGRWREKLEVLWGYCRDAGAGHVLVLRQHEVSAANAAVPFRRRIGQGSAGVHKDT